MNPDLSKLHPYPFEKLTKLKAQVTPPTNLAHIALSIGEPKHPAPQFVVDELIKNIGALSSYPTTKGLPQLRNAISIWLERRFKLQHGSVDPERHVLPVNGTREAIFAFTQSATDRTRKGSIVSPNPFYQIYEGAAILAGAELDYIPCLAENHFIPDFAQVPDTAWQSCQILFLCSPGNPTGSVIPLPTLKYLIELAQKHNFIIASDECYSEIYCNEDKPPVGLLEACANLGMHDFRNCIVFHSLSKRSNLPGLRSGFVAGDAGLIEKFLLYRTYHGCAMPIQHQLASAACWSDESHVKANRDLYREKFKRVLEILEPVMSIEQTDASFYLWPKTPISDERFAQELFAQQNVTVLPGRYLSRTVSGINPGENRIRMALVAGVEECETAARRIRSYIESIQ
ncbi:succinyldiaminopimelate transaminase [Oleiphilus messinensis]|uniref:Succinyldiaminopimelate transaminase n=1 Tax=Oleiphilus messinensis TaxID=141451 RepID=A0A1Y0I739_9GAMM|nr:succinyldiaminopimelate transaminase [Oleiphilus messinensis]ARU56040.1 succinyldiaminopimelate transaminase [Oleiphilus messinensis]